MGRIFCLLGLMVVSSLAQPRVVSLDRREGKVHYGDERPPVADVEEKQLSTSRGAGCVMKRSERRSSSGDAVCRGKLRRVLQAGARIADQARHPVR